MQRSKGLCVACGGCPGPCLGVTAVTELQVSIEGVCMQRDKRVTALNMHVEVCDMQVSKQLFPSK